MNTKIKNKGARRFAPWTAVLSLLVAIVLVAPTVVSAQTYTYELSQDCETAMVGTEHTITATVTNGDVPVQGVLLIFMFQGNNSAPVTSKFTNGDGIAEITFPGNDLGNTTIWLSSPPNPNVLAQIITEWTAEDLCSDAPGVTVGGRVTLNAKKNGTFRIALCSVDGLEVKDVVLDSVDLVGVKPWQSKYKDSRLCPDGKNGVKDLVFKFKNREVIEALEKNSPKELEDGDPVDLTLTFTLKGETTPREGTWSATIKKEGKMHRKKNHDQKEDEKDKGPKK